MSLSERQPALLLPAFLTPARWRQVLRQHGRAFLQGLTQLGRAPLTSLLTCLLVAIAIALPLALFVLLKNVDILGARTTQGTQLTLYLKNDTSDNEARTLLETLQHNPALRHVRAISPTDALREWRNQAGLDDVTVLNSNPLPWTLVISPAAAYREPQALTRLGHLLKQNPEVQSFQLDNLWSERLSAMMTLAERLMTLLASLLAVGVVLIVLQCTRALLPRHDDPDADLLPFSRHPFLYTGMLYGFLGGILAWQWVDGLLLALHAPAAELAHLYQSPWQLAGLGTQDTFSLLFISIALGFLGAWLATSRLFRHHA